MRLIRNLLLVALAAFLGSTLTGCGGDKTPATPGTSSITMELSNRDKVSPKSTTVSADGQAKATIKITVHGIRDNSHDKVLSGTDYGTIYVVPAKTDNDQIKSAAPHITVVKGFRAVINGQTTLKLAPGTYKLVFQLKVKSGVKASKPVNTGSTLTVQS
jgi:hypothetical protein